MKPLFKVELWNFHSVHLSQIYDGLAKLRNLGIVQITFKPIASDATKPLLTLKLDNKYTVIYDTLDGLNWIDGSIDENLNHFKNNIKADFYFKRSYNSQVNQNSPENCKVYPLGLNYHFNPIDSFSIGIKEKLKNIIKNNSFISKYFKNSSLLSQDFEYYPIPCKESKVLFLTRLWNPDDIAVEHLKREREEINKNRVDCIKACQRTFGKQFLGGLQKDSFSVRHAKELIINDSLTKKGSFLNTIRKNNICIATTGLHGSIGWKFGEYVAASRAIISEPLKYELPGNFENNKNYLSFYSKEELLTKADQLLHNKEAVFDMMKCNSQYYNNYLRSDLLVLNTLLKVYQNE